MDKKEPNSGAVPDPGVFVTVDMKITIPSFSIRFNNDGQVIDIDPDTLYTGLDLCPYWLEIALIRLSESDKAHKSLMDAKLSDDSNAIASSLRDEFLSGMQTIMACAVAIDAYYASIVEKIKIPESTLTAWRKNSTARYKQISEVLRIAFKIPKKSNNQLRELLKEVFRLRDRSVHPESGTAAPALHPELNKVSDWRYSAFRNHNAMASTRLALSIVDTTSFMGNVENQAVDAYSKETAKRIKPIIDEWKKRYGEL